MKITLAMCCVLWMSACGSKTAAPEAPAATAPAKPTVNVDAKTQQQLGIEVRPAASRSVAAAITSTGQLQLNEDRTWRVGAVLEGRVVAVPVHLGDYVRAGQVVAQMHSHEVHDARAEYRQAVSEIERLKVLAEQALRVRDRTKRLLDLKAASREQLEAAETQYRSAQLSVTNAQAEVDKTIAHITEFLDVPLQPKPGAAEGGADDPDRVPIKSPANGTVMERQANVGSVVSVGNPVVTVSDLSSLWLIAAVNEAELSQIRRGQNVKITVRAYPDKTFPGQVFQLGERMDPQTRTLQIRVLVMNSQGLLKPDMFANVDFAPQQERAAGVYVPESAVQDMEGKTVVFIQTKTGSFEPKEVKPGARVDRQIEILSGLEPGTLVVVNGAVILKSQLLKGE